MATTRSPIVTGVDFVGIPTRDLDVAMQFYGDVLGLPRTAYHEGMFAEYATGNLTLNIMNATKMGLPHEPVRNTIALHVDDMSAALAHLREHGIEPQGHGGEAPFDTGVCYMSFLEDPDGNALMLHHRHAPRD
ncbi:MAG: VOC family protein [Thermoleophilia bacterium]|nr:VOC family protein [Thermoleophilia bacterium]